MITHYAMGWIRKCAEYNVDAEALVKVAQIPAWGGQSKYVGAKRGLGGEAGYTYVMGLLPMPYAAARLGGPRFGVSLGLPSIVGIDSGRKPGLPFEPSKPRAVYKLIKDIIRERRRRSTSLSQKLKDMLTNQ